MKLSCVLFLFLILSCNSSEKKKTETYKEEKDPKKDLKTEETPHQKDGISLKQNGDYSSLFNLKKDDCSFVSTSDIVVALGLPLSNIKDISAYGRCSYEIILDDNSIWLLSLQWHPFSKNDITKEIQGYTEKDSPLTAQISKTKDTYLCIHPYNNWLMLFNNNYDGAVQISYCSAIECRKLNEEQKETRKQLALDLGNYILQKHKK